jgi:poly-gamma-glutamate capsule biosynthesis protein CapA/YwtB (metallophosphatase superfamily)
VIQPAIIKCILNKRVLVFSAGMASSGIPFNWKATVQRPGIYYLPDLSQDTLTSVTKNIKQFKKTNDIVIFSIHWDSNWGYDISETLRSFAHNLINIANIDVIFGHSSHHPRQIELYQHKILNLWMR